MEQFLGLIVVMVVWGVISYFGKAAKKQQAAAKLAMQKNNASQQPPQSFQTTSEIEKLIEMFSGNTIEKAPVENNSYIDTVPVSEEQSVESKGYVSLADSYKPLTGFLAFENYSDSFSEGGNIVSDLENHAGNEEILIKSKNSVHPLLRNFDLKKAVIYSEILQPRYF